MEKITKNKKYIVFGNFPDPNGLAEKLSEKLEVECLAFLSNTDNVSFIEYEEEDSSNIIKQMETQIKLLQKENSNLKTKLKSKWF